MSSLQLSDPFIACLRTCVYRLISSHLATPPRPIPCIVSRPPRVVESRRAKRSNPPLLCIALAAVPWRGQTGNITSFAPLYLGSHSASAPARPFEQAGNLQAVPPLRQPIKLSRPSCRASGQRPAGQTPQNRKRLFDVLWRAGFLAQRQLTVVHGSSCIAFNPVKEARTGSARNQTSRRNARQRQKAEAPQARPHPTTAPKII